MKIATDGNLYVKQQLLALLDLVLLPGVSQPAFLPGSSPAAPATPKAHLGGGGGQPPAGLRRKRGGENPRTSHPCVLVQFYLSHAASPIHETFNSRFPAAGSGPLTGYVKCIFTAVRLPTAELSEK